MLKGLVEIKPRFYHSKGREREREREREVGGGGTWLNERGESLSWDK